MNYSIEQVVALLERKYPQAEVYVYENESGEANVDDGNIHIYFGGNRYCLGFGQRDGYGNGYSDAQLERKLPAVLNYLAKLSR